MRNHDKRDKVETPEVMLREGWDDRQKLKWVATEKIRVQSSWSSVKYVEFSRKAFDSISSTETAGMTVTSIFSTAVRKWKYKMPKLLCRELKE